MIFLLSFRVISGRASRKCAGCRPCSEFNAPPCSGPISFRTAATALRRGSETSQRSMRSMTKLAPTWRDPAPHCEQITGRETERSAKRHSINQKLRQSWHFYWECLRPLNSPWKNAARPALLSGSPRSASMMPSGRAASLFGCFFPFARANKKPLSTVRATAGLLPVRGGIPQEK